MTLLAALKASAVVEALIDNSFAEFLDGHNIVVLMLAFQRFASKWLAVLISRLASLRSGLRERLLLGATLLATLMLTLLATPLATTVVVRSNPRVVVVGGTAVFWLGLFGERPITADHAITGTYIDRLALLFSYNVPTSLIRDDGVLQRLLYI